MFDLLPLDFHIDFFRFYCKVQTFCERLLNAERRSNIDLEDILFLAWWQMAILQD